MRIVLTGSHGSWKSTLTKHFDNRLEEVARKLIGKIGHPKDMSQEQLDNFELEIIQRQIAEETRLQDFISDRCVIDVLSYATSFATAKTLTRLKDTVDHYLEYNPYDLVFYTPIEFPLECDGTRFEWELYQQLIDLQIVKYLQRYKIEYIELRGSVEKRLATIRKHIALWNSSNLN